ncbi:Lysosome-associated membrane glycoprotein 1 [Dufourea novaeangliae]|uniref:Lysosome-associated membrane glycoprotein 5 n=2 Tax=Dufourea novaeangliae TaxID=178035 RepID=A0A154PP75_DUFNO|nr:Lysosome-associated membrane glycoprotein 1 [Dufourea novaeangliae]
MPVDNATTKATGNCGQFEQVLTLTWSSNNDTNGNMSLHFVRNETAKDYFIHHLEVVLPRTDFPNTTLNESMILTHKASNYVAGLTNSYRCMMKQKLNLKQNGTNETTGYIILSTLQFQAFKTDNSTTFGLAKDCAFKTSDVVPIAVGCALAGLVIAVLITYLIGRRRNQSRGYLSM